MPDGEVNVRFTTSADLTGAKATTESVKSTVAAVEKLTEETKKSAAESAQFFADQAHAAEQAAIKARVLANIKATRAGNEASGFGDNSEVATARIEKRLAAQRAAAQAEADNAAALKNAIGPAAELGKETEKLSTSKKTLRDVLKELSREIPGLHLAMTALKSPLVLAAGAAGLIISEFNRMKQAVADYAAAFEPFENISQRVLNFKVIALETAAARNAFAANLQKIADAGNNSASAFDRMNAALTRQRALQSEVAASVFEKRRAQADEALAAGRITPTQHARATGALDQAQLKLESERKLKAAREDADRKTSLAITADKRAADLQPSLQISILEEEASRKRMLTAQGRATAQKDYSERMRKWLKTQIAEAQGSFALKFKPELRDELVSRAEGKLAKLDEQDKEEEFQAKRAEDNHAKAEKRYQDVVAQIMAEKQTAQKAKEDAIALAQAYEELKAAQALIQQNRVAALGARADAALYNAGAQEVRAEAARLQSAAGPAARGLPPEAFESAAQANLTRPMRELGQATMEGFGDVSALVSGFAAEIRREINALETRLQNQRLP